jgi:diadenosine tetraphosphate (Ap4A) HIT family hydrolase
MSGGCEICERIARFTPSTGLRTRPDNPYVIAELDTGFAVLSDNQYYPGYTIFLAKQCVPELHDLPADVRSRFLQEMAQVAEAVFRAFTPLKLNYELLGNSVTHLHWHIFPRYAGDPNPRWPVWNNEAFLQTERPTQIDPAVLAERREAVQRALSEVQARKRYSSHPPAQES